MSDKPANPKEQVADPAAVRLQPPPANAKDYEEGYECGYLAGQGAQFVLLRGQRDELLETVKVFADWGIIVGPSTDTYIATIRKARALVDTIEGRDPALAEAQPKQPPPANAWIECAICRQQNSFGGAHWAWHQFCRAELNPVTLVQWLRYGWREDWREPMRRVVDYVRCVTGMDVEAAMEALKREHGKPASGEAQSAPSPQGSGEPPPAHATLVEWCYPRESRASVCGRCGGPHRFDVSIPSRLWNVVVRANGHDDHLCATCIIELFAAAGQSFMADISGGAASGRFVLVSVSLPSAEAQSACSTPPEDLK